MAISTGTTTDPIAPTSMLSPNATKKIAANTSRSGITIRSTRSRTEVRAITRPIISAPIASETPISADRPATRTTSPTIRIASSSSSRLSITLPISRAPQRAMREQQDQVAEADADPQGQLARRAGPGQQRGEQRQVEREEQVLDDDDAEDDRGLGVGQPAQLDEQLGGDRRRRDADRAGDDERLRRCPSRARSPGPARRRRSARCRRRPPRTAACRCPAPAPPGIPRPGGRAAAPARAGPACPGPRGARRRPGRRCWARAGSRRA